MGAPADSTATAAAETSAGDTSRPRPTISRAYHRAHHNIVGHGLRDARRLLVLITADLTAFACLWLTLHGLRDGWLGAGVADVMSRLFSAGFLGGVSRFAVALVISLFITGAYGAGQRRRDTDRVVAGVALAALVSLYATAWDESLTLAAVRFVATLIVVTPALMLTRLAVDRIVRAVRRGTPVSRAIVVTHDGSDAGAVAEGLMGLREFAVVEVLRVGGGSAGDLDASLADLITSKKADTVLLWGDLTEAEFAKAVDLALASGCRLLAVSRATRAAGVQPKAVWVDGRALVELTTPRLTAWQLAAKRVIDVSGALVGLVLVSPVLAAIALWIRRDSPGPVLFRQTRLGRRGEQFLCYKFRSMRQDAEEALLQDPDLYARYVENSYKLPLDEDPRVTPSGRFLRRTSLDELPQLLNVLLGQMSLVGPRPIVPEEIQEYGGGAGLFLSLKPGMTGAWAVNGRSRVGYPDRVQMELEYTRSWSVLSDLAILARTLPAVVLRRGSA